MPPKANQPPYPKKPAAMPPKPKGKLPKLPPVALKDSMARRLAK